MEYISNNIELRNAIKALYKREIQPYQLADIYFKYRIYSAASTYYNWEIYNLHNSDKSTFNLKSYCFFQIANCYFNQQKNQNFSGWQLSMIHDMCKEALSYNETNYKAIILLGICQIKQERFKDAYFTYNSFILNLDKYFIKEEDYKEIIKVFIVYFELCERFFIIKYDYIYKIMIEFLSSNKNTKYDDIILINKRYQEHLNKISNYERNIINGNI